MQGVPTVAWRACASRSEHVEVASSANARLTPPFPLPCPSHLFPQAEFDFAKMVEQLPADEPRYLVLDWEGVNKDECQVSKIFFVSWVPDTCKAKTKMLYASSKQALRNALDGVHLDHQATDYDEITPEEFNERSGL